MSCVQASGVGRAWQTNFVPRSFPQPSPPLAPIVAWVDESGSNHRRDPNTYMVAAAVCLEENVEVARLTMQAMQFKGERKIHWRDDTPNRHRDVTAAIAQMRVVEHVVVVRSRPDDASDRIERRRRKVMERLLFELTSMDVGHAIIESRGPADNQRDLDLLSHLRRRRSLPRSIRLDHTPGPADPMLWVPDAVCGAVSEMRCGDPVYYAELTASINLIEI